MNDYQKQALGYIVAQLIVAVVVSAILVFFGWTAAYSALIGGLIATLANAWFAVKVFSTQINKAQGEEPIKLLRRFYQGEIYKILLTAALFLLAFVLIKPVNALALLITYFLVHMTPAVVNAISGEKHYES